MKRVNENNVENLKDVILCIVIPFTLFWFGIVVASFSSFELFMPLGLIPFYIYSYFAANISVRPVYREIMIAQHFVGIISLAALIFAFLFGWFPEADFVKNLNASALLNLPFLFLITIFGSISVGGNMRWGSWDDRWPD